jgi:N-acyl-D-aspartate/D-glutamate deacylase
MAGANQQRLGLGDGGAKRMVMRSRGIEYTIINGVVTWERGALTGAAAGQVLRL